MALNMGKVGNHGPQGEMGKPGVGPLGKDYSQHLKTKPVTAEVSSSKSVAGKEVAQSMGETEILHAGVFTDGMSITVEGGRTLNLGNYESAKIGVSITVPCDKESLNDAYTYATEWVSAKIEEAVALAKT